MSNNGNQGEKLSVDEESAVTIEKKLELNANPQARITNALAGISRAQLLRNVEDFAKEKDLIDILPILSKGAIRKFVSNRDLFRSLLEYDITSRTKSSRVRGA